jgi:hypothetical protein
MPSASDSAPLRSDEVVVGCVTEDNPKFLGQTLRLLQSIRWFGGSLAQARVIVGAVESIDRRARRTLESMGAGIRIVPRFELPNGSANRLQLFPMLREEKASHFLMLDCDTLVVRDPLPLFKRGVFHAKIAPFPTVTHDCFERLFAHFGLPLPERTFVTPYSRTPTIPYFNAGVFSLSREVGERLVPEWRRFNAILAAEPELASPCARHLHQAALSLALVSSGVPFAEAGSELNYQLNATRRPPRSYVATDPCIIHYHDLVGEDGLLLPTRFPHAQTRIDEFHRRLREERERALAVRKRSDAPPRQVVVLAPPRAGGSLAAQTLAVMGAFAGDAHELLPPDVYHPQGSSRRRDVDLLHREIMTGLGATWLQPERGDVTRLGPGPLAEAKERARAIAKGLTGPSLLYDGRMPLLFPIWREVLDRPFCVLVWREPVAAARSLYRASGVPLGIGLAVWEEYTRRMLSATAGLPRVLMSLEQLASGQLAPLLDELPGLHPPDPAALRALLLPFVDQNGDAGEHFLDEPQRKLRDALRSGEAVDWDVVEPTREETRVLLSAFGSNEAAARRAAELQQRLDAVTGSRVWRLRSHAAALWRRLT